MKIKVSVTPCNLKYIEYMKPKGLKVKRQEFYYALWNHQRKFRGGENVKKFNDKIYSSTISFNCSLATWLRQSIKGNEDAVMIIGFNKMIRDLFYQYFFFFMNERLILKLALNRDSQQIREFAIEFMAKLNLSEEDINLETLLRNYRRYRETPNLGLYDLIDSLDD